MDVAEWLRGLGLDGYIDSFRDNEIDGSVLSSLTAEDLKDLGVTLVGHRRKLLNAIMELGEPVETPLQPSPSGSEGPRPPTQLHKPAEAERRQLSLLFVDLVGSTDMGAALDPEEMRDVIQTYHTAVTSTVVQEGGHVAKYMGDGVLAYFGWPVAREDACERAVTAGLAAIETVSQAVAPWHQPLLARAGIATGTVVVGDLIGEGAARESGVVGDTPNLAARLQAAAAPGTLVIAETTARLVGRLFDLEDLGGLEIKGLAKPVRAFRVLREAPREGRFEALRSENTLPFIGRDEEIRLLCDRWNRATRGEGQVVQLIGEPGIGKSRILAEFRSIVEQEPHVRLRYFCAPHHQNSALYPCIQQLVRSAGVKRDDPPERRLEKLAAVLGRGSEPTAENFAAIAVLLEIPIDDSVILEALSPQKRKALQFEAMLEQLDGLSTTRPVLMLLEDIQWLDPTSLELFDIVVNRIADRPILLVATSRPDVQVRWMNQPHGTVLTLNRLGRADTGRIITSMTEGRSLPPQILEHILERTEGIPLFVEELTKVVLESGIDRDALEGFALSPNAIPMTLQDSLMARLDRLAPIKEVAQIGSVVGREFTLELLQYASGLPEAELESAIAQLLEAELIFQRGSISERRFTFKHALMQDAAYGSLLKSKRQLIHARIAAALEERSTGDVEKHPEVLAHHFTEAGQIDKAVEYWRHACQVAMDRSATAEAIAHSHSGLAVLMQLPEGPERDRQELAIQLAMGSALVAAHGFAAQPTGKAYERARELCEALGEKAQLYPVIYGLCLFNLYGGDINCARENASRLIEFAENSNDRDQMFFACRAAGVTDLPSGRFASAQAHLDRALHLYDEKEHRTPMFIYAFDPKVVCLDYLSRALFPMGLVVQALKRSEEALSTARRTGHLNSVALPLFFGGTLQQLCGRLEPVKRLADELLQLAVDEDFKLWAAGAWILQGWAMDKCAEHGEGEALVRRGVEEWTATGAVFMLPYFHVLLAEMRIEAGAAGEATQLLDDALARIEVSGERWFEAEVHRTKGRALSLLGEAEAAASCTRAALDVATAQGAGLWRLRAALDLYAFEQEQDTSGLSASLAAIPEILDLPEIVAAQRALSRQA